MDKRRINQLLGLSGHIISTTLAVLTSHSVMGRYAETMRHPFNEFCRGCRSAEEEETVVHFLCQCLRLLLGIYIDYLDPHFLSVWLSYHLLISRIWLHILSFLFGFPAWGNCALMCSPCANQPPPLLRFWRNLVSTGTAFTRGIRTGRHACSSKLCLFDISDLNRNLETACSFKRAIV